MRFEKITNVLSETPKFSWQTPGSVCRSCEPWCKRKSRHYGPCLRFTLEDVEKQPSGIYPIRYFFGVDWGFCDSFGVQSVCRFSDDGKLIFEGINIIRPTPSELNARRWQEVR